MTEPSTVGERLAFHRKRRGLSQVALGKLIGRSESWVSQVERGTRTVDRLSVLAQVADALNIPVSELAPDVPQDALPAEYSPYIAELRRVLTGHPALAAVLGADSLSAPSATDVERLAERAGSVWPLVHASRYAEVAPLLAELIPELEVAGRSLPPGEQRANVFRTGATVYQAAAALLAKLGDVESGWIASDRALTAAEQAEEPLLVIAAQYRMAHALMGPARLAHARYTAQAAADALEDRLLEARPEAISLWGGLHLTLAIIAAREGNRGTAREHLNKAAEAAARVGEGRNDFDTEFGPTNVRLHEVSVAVELGDAGDALDRAAGIDRSGLSPERRARFLIDLARAYGQRRRTADAVASLLEAEALTPEQVWEHPRVRELVADLQHSEGRRASAELKAFAHRVGVLT
ncbi:helix-turn-helix domain-containing protein [Protofrankia symbiont of Coriaria ruscifolia]|uniref:helix-turn-helix domain-containing protein n=1 Tax=Protofrankia symbiont of Coriaria ruscifolia TaxID=1306542 RepID=UPI001040F276|nr:helix-turn-helix transcriptional regulator [Protofrankia symbiont of Coriaria ruscifolia]